MSSGFDPNFNVPLAYPDTNEETSGGKKYKMHEAIHLGYGLEADYGANWGSITVDDLPQTDDDADTPPTDFKWCFRRNSNATGGSTRLFVYNAGDAQWEYIDFSDGSTGTVS